jgi:subtilisin family serine protease
LAGEQAMAVSDMEKAGRRTEKPVRIYAVLRKTAKLLASYRTSDPREARIAVKGYLQKSVPLFRKMAASFDVIDLPSLPSLKPGKAIAAIVDLLETLVVTIVVSPQGRDYLMREGLGKPRGKGELVGLGHDAPIHAGRSWQHGPVQGRTFWDRAAAERLIGADALGNTAGITALTGKGVNVVLMDSGLDTVERQQLGLPFGLRWTSSQHQIYAAQTTTVQSRHGHGWLIARQIRSLARRATIHDYALLPPRLSRAVIPSMAVRVPAFVSDVVAAFGFLKAQVLSRHNAGDQSAWIVVNAWSIFARTWTPGQDLDDPSAWLNQTISELVELGVDLVFAAGNCGLFGPDLRCGQEDTGPGCSIVGPNGHPEVLTVGAVRDDGLWLGYSSQGPGIMGGAGKGSHKPDLCAPSEFRDTDDAARLNSGTSSACGVAAGAIAALRQEWPKLPPAVLKQALLDTARDPEAVGWSPRLGHGVLDLPQAIKLIRSIT